MLEEKETYTDKWYFENFKCLKKIKAKGDFKAGIGLFNLKQSFCYSSLHHSSHGKRQTVMKACRLEGNSNSLECPEEGERAVGSDYFTGRPDNPEKI